MRPTPLRRLTQPLPPSPPPPPRRACRGVAPRGPARVLRLALLLAAAASAHARAAGPEPEHDPRPQPPEEYLERCHDAESGNGPEASLNYSILYNYLTGTGAHRFADSITLGFLASYGSQPVELGALPLAVEAVNRDPLLLPGRTLRYSAMDIGAGARRGSSALAALAIRCMTEMRDAGTVAFIGPDDSCAAEALVAAAWNLPMISYKCADTRVSDKNVYNTFARTLPPSSKVSKSVVALLRAFGWNKFVVVAGSRPAWGGQVLDAIRALSDTHGLHVTAVRRFAAADYISTASAYRELERIVAETYERTRVYVFVGEHIALIDFVNCLQRRGLLQRGEYAVISVDDEIYDPSSKLSIVSRAYLDPYLQDDAINAFKDIAAFRSVLKLTPSHPRNTHYKELCEKIRNMSAQPPFCVPYHRTVFDSISVPVEAVHLYDAVLIYARALTEALEAGEDPRNGTDILQRIRNRTYHSMRGHDVLIDANGDAEGNFTVMALLDDAEVETWPRMSMQPVGVFWYPPGAGGRSTDLPEFRYVDARRPINWVGGEPPPAEPPCGFRGERCGRPPDWRVVLAGGALGALLLVAAVFACRHYRYEQKLACLLWKIDMRDVTLIPAEANMEAANAGGRSTIQLCRPGSVAAEAAAAAVSAAAAAAEPGPKRAYTTIGLYKGNIVAIKRIHKRSVDLTRSIRKELKQVREARHENLLPFIGASVEHGAVALLSAYCARGSLRDVLANKDMRLDAMFVSSLVADLLKGLIYLHDSDIISHGNLHSSNCLVDSRWVLQIGDFGLHEFKAGQEEPDGAARERRRRLWRAPELLRAPFPPPRGSQKGDVYSFGIVLFEIVGQAGPWGDTTLSDEEIVDRVRNPDPGIPLLRPDTSKLAVPESVRRCLESCWDEDPDSRPDIRFVRVKLKEMQAGLKPNIFDNMLAIMEKYAYNLEGLVQERTNQLTEEKKKTDALLHRMLPKTVAEALKRGDPVQAESFECVTIFFSDIVGFTELSAVSTPWQVVDLLNDLYTCCDSIISHYDVYKVETIGDAYMVASGLPVRNGDRHAGEVASMALQLQAEMCCFEIRHRPGETLQLRIGIHSGHCVAGVVGLKMPRYCLFGDTVNTASRMESTGEPSRIHISETTHCLLQSLGGYVCEERGLTYIKGKGEMRTFWLVSENPSHRLSRLRASTDSYFRGISNCVPNLETPDLLRCETTSPLFLQQQPEHKQIHYLRQRALCSVETMHSGGSLPSPTRPTTLPLHLLCSEHITTRCHRSAPSITFCDTSVP